MLAIASLDQRKRHEIKIKFKKIFFFFLAVKKFFFDYTVNAHIHNTTLIYPQMHLALTQAKEKQTSDASLISLDFLLRFLLKAHLNMCNIHKFKFKRISNKECD